MSSLSLRLRRVLTLSSSTLLHHHHKPLPSITPPHLSTTPQNPNPNPIHNLPSQSIRSFKSSTTSLSSRARQPYNRDNEDKFGPDDILFEGCDYNHWLITMDFPKDPKPTPEEMVETYVQTCAKVVGSVEEAKKRIYACSTTTYQGFQVEVSEEMSEKFQSLPGVVFVLPDSYIDPVNKEYGGDKYINGTIIPRPPPVQYGRTGGRYNDRNREFNRPNRQRGPYQQGNTTYGNQGPTHGDTRNFGQQIPPPQQNYGPPRTFDRRDPMPMNNAPPNQSNFGQGDRGNYNRQEQRDFQPGVQRDRGNYNPQEQRDFQPGVQRNYAPSEQRDFRGNYAPPQSGSYGQGTGQNFSQGEAWAGGNYGQGAGGNFGQGAGGGYGPADGNYGQAADGPNEQATGSAYGQSEFGKGENQPPNTQRPR
ncbi:hypothetical protein LguiB_006743 [Lonicera macranthoides]